MFFKRKDVRITPTQEKVSALAKEVREIDAKVGRDHWDLIKLRLRLARLESRVELQAIDAICEQMKSIIKQLSTKEVKNSDGDKSS
ncbi:MAG: hypothetical protein BWY43_00297 [candidate division WS2 bacterium ADurb.Bin280]|uniref:Uncharacterized protein n=1 Tax=candidate division WS2 bacterium ADurb.Bin280 TaxID=1852829 RepID=A0A1V5SEH3_9BACT|nr:MAG: hypothetical protein BWY43_00297 [candidate division WS2 bacterium ADurb.Bin280]